MNNPQAVKDGDAVIALLPEEAKDWLRSLRGPQAEAELRRVAGPLAIAHAAALGKEFREGDLEWPDYEGRVASALAYHWWRFSETGPRSLDWVAAEVCSGRLAFGRYDADVTRDVVLAEAFVRGVEGAASRFLADYSELINDEAKRCGSRGPQELEGLEGMLILPRADRPPRLSLFAGRTPLRDWLRRVLRHEWIGKIRLESRPNFKPPPPLSPPPPHASVHDRECFDVLRPLFAQAIADTPAEEVLLLRQVMLDSVPQHRIAEFLGVNKSTVSRRVTKAGQSVLTRFQELAHSSRRDSAYEQCLGWMLHESPGGRLALADEIARSIRLAPGPSPTITNAEEADRSPATPKPRWRKSL